MGGKMEDIKKIKTLLTLSVIFLSLYSCDPATSITIVNDTDDEIQIANIWRGYSDIAEAGSDRTLLFSYPGYQEREVIVSAANQDKDWYKNVILEITTDSRTYQVDWILMYKLFLLAEYTPGRGILSPSYKITASQVLLLLEEPANMDSTLFH
jgi:hypothetical protein